MAAKDDLGRAGEKRAVEYLRGLGYRILDRNWRCPEGEIDIVASDGRELVIVEVKTRRTEWFGHPLEAVDARKQKRLWRLASAWMRERGARMRITHVRVDAVAIVGANPDTAVLEHLKDLR